MYHLLKLTSKLYIRRLNERNTINIPIKVAAKSNWEQIKLWSYRGWKVTFANKVVTALFNHGKE